jgi:hypothetical protein
MPRDRHMGDTSREGDEAWCFRGPASARPCRWRRRRPRSGPRPESVALTRNPQAALAPSPMKESLMATSRGRAAPRRLTSRQSRAVKRPQAAIPEVVRALFSSSSSVGWTLEAAGVSKTLPFTTTSQPSRSVGPLPVACSERVSASSVRPQRSPGRAALLPPSPGRRGLRWRAAFCRCGPQALPGPHRELPEATSPSDPCPASARRRGS